MEKLRYSPRHFLVSVEFNGKTRKLAWDAKQPLALDHPPQWFLVYLNGKLYLRRAFSTREDRCYEISEESISSASTLVVKSAGRNFSIKVENTQRLAPIYARQKRADSDEIREKGFSQIFLYWGTRHFLIGLQALHKKFSASIGNRSVFELKRLKSGLELLPLADGICFIDAKGRTYDLQKGHPYCFKNEEAFVDGCLQWAKHWWRLNKIFTAEPVDLEKIERAQIKENKVWKRVNWGLAMTAGVLIAIAALAPKTKEEVPEKKPVAVALKTPKVVSLPKEPQPSPPRAAKAPRPKPSQAKVQLAKRATPKSAPKEIAKALNFLSAKQPQAKSVKPANTKARPLLSKNDLKVERVHDEVSGHTPVQLASASQTTADVAFTGDAKQLNEVRGSVSAAELYDPNSVDGIASSVGGSGMSLSGDGQLASAEIEKELSKYLTKFQYCYEKALLSNSSLGGSLVMQWQVSHFGNTSEVKVVRSELNHDALHSCVSRQLAEIRFPSPKGGSVTVKYPFNFSSTSL